MWCSFPIHEHTFKRKIKSVFKAEIPTVYKQKQNKSWVNLYLWALSTSTPLAQGGISALHNEAWGAHFVMLNRPQWCNSRGGGISSTNNEFPSFFQFKARAEEMQSFSFSLLFFFFKE